MVTKKFIFSIILAGLLIANFGCKKDENDDPAETTSSVIEEDSEYGNIAKGVIGRGYDISGRFAYSEDIKESVLDFTALTNNKKILLDGNIAETEVKTREGETIQEYQNSFSYAQSGSVGVSGVFSAEAGFNFGYDRAQTFGYSFATINSFTSKYGIYIDGRLDPSSLTSYASNDFLGDAESMDIETFINTYGTHVIVGGKWGASFDYSMSAKRTSESSSYSFGAFAKASATVEGIDLGGSTEINTEFSTYYKSETKETAAKAKGGNSEYALAIATASTPEGLDQAYSDWVGSIDENPAFCDYYEGGLVPIYEFITDESLKATIKTGVEDYLASQEITTTDPETKTISDSFHSVGFCIQNTQGDDEVDADGGEIYVYLKFSLGKAMDSDTDLDLNIEMEVHEMKGDYTILTGSTTYKITNNSDRIEDFNLEHSLSFTSTYDPDDDEYASLDTWDPQHEPLPSWLNNISIRVDGPGGNDGQDIGVKGDIEVEVTVIPSIICPNE